MKYLISIIFSLLLLSGNVFAQQEGTGDQPENDPQNEENEGYTGNVTVLGKHNPRVSDAFKLKENPTMEKVEIEKEEVEYQIRSTRLPVSFELDPIRPARMVGEPLDKLYNNHMRIGMGTSTMPYLEYFYNNTRSRDNAFGIHLKHLSAAGKIDKHPFPGFSDNLAEVYYKRFFKNHILTAEAGYERNVLHAYGVPTEIYDTLSSELKKDDIRLLYNRITASVGFSSDYPAYDDDKIHHDMNLDFYHFSDDVGAREMNFYFTGDFNKKINFLKAAKEQYAGVKLEADYLVNSWDSINNVNTGIFRFTPYLNNTFNNITLNAGVNIYVDADSVSSRIEFYPDVHMNMELIENIFVLKGGITGKTGGDYLNGLTRENPFMRTMVPLEFQYHRSIIYAGLNASISKSIDFNTYFEASNTENMTFFMRDTTDALGNRFTLEHDSVRSIHVNAEIEYHLKDKLNVTLGARYSEYSTTKLDEPWNLPAIQGYLKARYNLQEKIIANAELFYIGERKAIGLVDGKFDKVSLDHVFDANISLEYRYNKLLSGFLSFRNLAAGQYEKWASYPTYGFQFMAGLTYSM